MKLRIVVKQKEEKSVVLENVKTYFYTKYNLEISLENGKKHLFKMSTVLELEES